MQIDDELGKRLQYLGIIPDDSHVRDANEGTSDYNSGKHIITPWSIWLDYPELTPFEHDIIKRILRKKKGDPRSLDFKKIIHICQELLRQEKYK